MTPRTVYWRLGLFFVASLVCVVLGLSLFGSRALGQKTVDYETFFDESVGGLGVGSPVRFRGIIIGRVDRIGLAPDRRHVEVTCALGVGHLRRLGLATDDGPHAVLALQPDMRAQLARDGLTGPQTLSIDYFDPATHPPPELPFPVPARTIPSTPSALAGIEDSLATAAERLPGLVDRASRLLEAGNDLFVQLGDARLGERTAETLHGVDEVLNLLRSAVARLNTERVPEQIGHAVTTLDGALSRLDGILSSVDSQGGLVTSAQRATEAVGDAARGSRDVERQLSATLQEVRQTAATIRRLTDALDRTPDMLVKGRPKGEP
jgi:ABC-type transporter Mla subunit MlaD